MAFRKYLDGCIAAIHEQVLDAREARAKAIQALIKQFGKPVLCTKLNIPGEIKSFPLADKAFDVAIAATRRQIERHEWRILFANEKKAITGNEALLVIDCDSRMLKKSMITVEEEHPLGRLFDLDVFDGEGNSVSGEVEGRRERSCFICQEPVWACARSRKHSAQELVQWTIETIAAYFDNEFVKNVAAMAVRALLYEVSATPKPGLVDRANNGAHHDMDFFSFIDSASVLHSYFEKMLRRGLSFDGKPDMLLPTLRFDGMEAESDMLKATGGVNTHKGAIFSLGIFCAAFAFLQREGEVTPDNLRKCVQRIARGSLADFETDKSASYGEQAYAQYRLTGARGEAAAGFPSVFLSGYPRMEAFYASGASHNDTGVATLLKLISVVDDTNIIHRKGIATLRKVQEEAKHTFYNANGDMKKIVQAARELDERYIEQHISPGGAADMLALCYFLHFAFDKADHL